MYLVYEVLCLIGADFGTTSDVQTITKYPLYGHLLAIAEKHLRKFK